MNLQSVWYWRGTSSPISSTARTRSAPVKWRWNSSPKGRNPRVWNSNTAILNVTAKVGRSCVPEWIRDGAWCCLGSLRWSIRRVNGVCSVDFQSEKINKEKNDEKYSDDCRFAFGSSDGPDHFAGGAGQGRYRTGRLPKGISRCHTRPLRSAVEFQIRA